MMSEMMNPQRSANRIPMEWPWIRVPRQKLRTSAMGLSLNSYRVARSAAVTTVAASSNIQNFEFLRVFREYAPDAPVTQSGEDTDAENRCQNSEVAIVYAA